MSQSKKPNKSEPRGHNAAARSPKFLSKRRSTKPLLSTLTQQDTGNRLITPSSRSSHLHSAIYTIDKPTPTFLSADEAIHNTEPEKTCSLSRKSAHIPASQERNTENRNDSNHTLDTATMRAKYILRSSRKTKRLIPSTLNNKKEREKIVTSTFIDTEMKKLSYSAYIRSPFSFIDRVEANEITETEFVYLHSLGAYDLEIVSSADVNDAHNYYTLSRRGLTHFYQENGETEVCFTPLDEWQREYYLFTSMMNIPFFRRYKKWKCFRHWKKSIHRKKIKKCNRLMNNNLFILNKHLRAPLLEIRKLCISMMEWKLFLLKDTKTKHAQPLTLEQFLSLQTEHRVCVSDKLHIMCDKIKVELLRACDNRLHHHLIDNGFKATAAHREDISHAQRAAIRTECRSLTKFIKMVDSFIQDAVITMCRQNVKSLLKYIENVEKSYKLNKHKNETNDSNKRSKLKTTKSIKSKGDKSNSNSIFLIHLDIDDASKQFQLDPLVRDFKEAISCVIHEAISVVLEPPNFCRNDEDLARFTSENDVGSSDADAAEENAIDLEQLLLTDPLFVSDMRQIQSGIMDAFKESVSWVDSLSDYLLIYFEKSPDKLSFEMTNAHKFDEYLTKYTAQQQQFASMPMSKDISMLRIECKTIRDKFTPIPKERMKFIVETLPKMALLKCCELESELCEMNEKIKKTPLTVSDFVEFKAHLRDVHLRDEEIEYRFNEINDMFVLINKHKIRLPKDTTKQHAKLHQIRSTLTTNVSISDSSIDDSTTKFVNYMRSATPQLIRDIASIRTSMENDQILATINKANLNENLTNSLLYIQQQDDKLSEYEQLAKDYAQYQANLDIEITEYERLTDTRNDLNMKKDLWLETKEFHELCIKWKKCKLTELNMDDMQTQIKTTIKSTGKISRYFNAQSQGAAQAHAVVEYLKENVFELKRIMPIIEHLSSPSLNERHWAQLQEVLKYDVLNDDAFTLGTIFTQNFIQFEKEISFIAVQAAQEQSLIELLNKIVLIWKDCDIPLQNYKDYKGCYILGGLDDIIANLDEYTFDNLGTLSRSVFK